MESNGESENESRDIRERYEFIVAGILGASIALFLIYFVESLILGRNPNITTLVYVFTGIAIGLIIGRYIIRRKSL